MSKEAIKRLHLIYGIVLSVLLAVVAVLFIVMCVDINSLGGFTRARIGEHFAKISAFVYILIAFVICGGILNTVAPIDKPKNKGAVKDAIILDNLSKKLKTISEEASKKIEKQRAIRFIMLIISAILVIGASIASLIFVLSTFDATSSEAMNSEVVHGFLSVLRFFIGPIAYLIVTVYVCKKSIKTEIEVVKGEIKRTATSTEDTESAEDGTFTKLSRELKETVKNVCQPKKWHKRLSIAITSLVLCVSLSFIITDCIMVVDDTVPVEEREHNPGMKAVANKATNICAECIGLG